MTKSRTRSPTSPSPPPSPSTGGSASAAGACTASVRFGGVYFATYANQSGYNPRHEATLLFPLNRVTPYIGGTYLSTNDRPGYEITERIRRTETGANGGLYIRLSSKLDLDLKGRETTYRYDEGETTNYGETLDRRTEIYGAQARYRVTSLTTLTFLADAVRERYTGTPERDNDGYRLLPGVEFGEHALITGKAEFGYRSLSTPTLGVPDFSGFVGNAELSYVFRSMTRFTVGASRDIFFSYSNIEPFYIQPGLTLSITQQVAGPWDVQARGAWYRLDYQRVEVPGAEQFPERVDEYQTWGGGIGYRVGRRDPGRLQRRRISAPVDPRRSGLRWDSRRHGGHLCT